MRFEKRYDYEDMKIAMVVQEFYCHHDSEMFKILENGDKFWYEDCEDLIDLCEEIRNGWKKDNYNEILTTYQYAYIQVYAYDYLKNKFNIKE